MTTTAATRARTALMSWRTPVYQVDCEGAAEINTVLREMILAAEKTDTQAANFGGIDAIKSSQGILRWQHPAIDWLKARIMNAVTALTDDVLGDAASEVTQGVLAEAWAVVYRGGGSLRPHTHHDSAWSGVYYVESGAGEDGGEAGYLQLLDPPARGRCPPSLVRCGAHPADSRPHGGLPRLVAALRAGDSVR